MHRSLSAGSRLSDVREAFLEHCRNRTQHTSLKPLTPGTLRTYRQGLKGLGWLGEIAVGDLRPAQVLTRVDELMVDDPGTAGSKPAKFAEVLRAMLSWSRQRDLCVHNAAAQLRIEYRPVPRIPLTLQQARLLWWEIDDVAAQRRPMCGRKRDAEYWLAWSGVPDVLRLLMLTAARRSEICRARREWLQLDERQLLVPYAKGHPRVLALGPNALAIFRQRFELTEGRSEYLFPSLTKHGAPLDGARVLELFHQLTTRTGLNRASPTTPGRRQFCLATLRNSLATWAKRKGKSIDTIAELLGHRDRKTTKRIYTIYAADPDALALVDAFDAELLTTHTQEVP